MISDNKQVLRKRETPLTAILYPWLHDFASEEGREGVHRESTPRVLLDTKTKQNKQEKQEKIMTRKNNNNPHLSREHKCSLLHMQNKSLKN